MKVQFLKNRIMSIVSFFTPTLVMCFNSRPKPQKMQSVCSLLPTLKIICTQGFSNKIDFIATHFSLINMNFPFIASQKKFYNRIEFLWFWCFSIKKNCLPTFGLNSAWKFEKSGKTLFNENARKKHILKINSWNSV